MKTKLIVISGILFVLAIVLMPTGAAQAARQDCAIQAADGAVQMQACDGQQRGNRSGPQDGTKGQNAPRDGRGRANGGGKGQCGGPRDGSGPNCPK